MGERAGAKGAFLPELKPSVLTALPFQKEAFSSAARRGPGLQEGRGEDGRGGEARLQSQAQPLRSARLSALPTAAELSQRLAGREQAWAGGHREGGGQEGQGEQAGGGHRRSRWGPGEQVGAALSHFHSPMNARPQGL